MSTNEKLILAGIEILDEQGIENFSMRAVTKRCGFASSAVPYEYFADKRVFFIALAAYQTQLCYEEGKKADLTGLLKKGLTEVQAKQYVVMKIYGEKCREHPWLPEVFFLLRSAKKCKAEKQVPYSMRHIPYLMKEIRGKDYAKERKIPYAHTAEMFLTLYVYGAGFISKKNESFDWIPEVGEKTSIDFLKKMEEFLQKNTG